VVATPAHMLAGPLIVTTAWEYPFSMKKKQLKKKDNFSNEKDLKNNLIAVLYKWLITF
jgi:hypothetical protein